MKIGSLFLLVCCIVIDNCEAQNINPYYPTSASLLRSPSSLLSIGGFGGGLGGGDFLPEDSVTALGVKQQLIRRFHYLEYIKAVYKKLKQEYTRYVSECLLSSSRSVPRSRPRSELCIQNSVSKFSKERTLSDT